MNAPCRELASCAAVGTPELAVPLTPPRGPRVKFVLVAGSQAYGVTSTCTRYEPSGAYPSRADTCARAGGAWSMTARPARVTTRRNASTRQRAALLGI